MRKIPLLFFLSFFFYSACAAPIPLNLKNCISIAIAQNSDLRAAFASVKESEAVVSEKNAALLPSLGLSYNWTKKLSPLGAPIPTTIGTFRSQPLLLNYYTDGVSLNQLIYDGEKTASLVKQAKALSEAQRSQYHRLMQSITLQTTEAVYHLLADRQLVNVAEEDLNNADAHLDLVKAGYEAGTAAKADIVFAEVPVATAKLNLTKSKEQEKDTEAGLNRLLSFNLDTSLEIRENLEEKPYSIQLEEAYREALRNRDEIKQSNHVVESSQAQLNAARGSYWPVISLFSTYGYTDYGAKVLPQNLGYTYGLQGTYSIFDGNLQAFQTAEAGAALEKNQFALESAKQNVLLDVKKAFLSFQSAKESVEEAGAELAKAEENLKMVEVQYKAGIVPVLNLLDAETSRTAAATHLIEALSNYNISIAQFEYSVGR